MPRITCLEAPRTGTESRHHNAQSFKWVLDHIGCLFLQGKYFDLLIHLPGPPEKCKDLMVSYLFYPVPEKRISSYKPAKNFVCKLEIKLWSIFFFICRRGQKTFSGVHRFWDTWLNGLMREEGWEPSRSTMSFDMQWIGHVETN